MLSLAHEIAVILLAEEPWLLGLLAEKLRRKIFPHRLHRIDSTVRFGAAREIRPDALFMVAGSTRWVALEVQLRRDRAKTMRWPVLLGILMGEHRTMGDIVIVTPSRRVAEWARNASLLAGLIDTRNRFEPTVLCVSDDKVDRLLDEADPRLAFFAAWAVHHRYSKRARRVVEKALRITKMLPARLRRTHTHAIFGVLNERLRLQIGDNPMPQETSQHSKRSSLATRLNNLLRTHAEARGRLQGKANGKQEDLFTILKVRGLTPSPIEKAQVLACSTIKTLDRWIAGAIHASSVEEVLSLAPQRAVRRGRRAARMTPTEALPCAPAPL